MASLALSDLFSVSGKVVLVTGHRLIKRNVDVEGTDWDAIGSGVPRGRVGTPEDIVGLTIYLCSRAGAFTVGDVITCDGGIVVS